MLVVLDVTEFVRIKESYYEKKLLHTNCITGKFYKSIKNVNIYSVEKSYMVQC